VIGEAQQVQPHGRQRHSAQLVGGVELDQRGVVFDALVGQAGGREKALGELVQRLEALAPRDLLAQLLVAEVLGSCLRVLIR
jgi:hypothetical protein